MVALCGLATPRGWAQFRVLVWKNWVIKKRQASSTLAELLLPVACMCLLVYLHSLPDMQKVYYDTAHTTYDSGFEFDDNITKPTKPYGRFAVGQGHSFLFPCNDTAKEVSINISSINKEVSKNLTESDLFASCKRGLVSPSFIDMVYFNIITNSSIALMPADATDANLKAQLSNFREHLGKRYHSKLLSLLVKTAFPSSDLNEMLSKTLMTFDDEDHLEKYISGDSYSGLDVDWDNHARYISAAIVLHSAPNSTNDGLWDYAIRLNFTMKAFNEVWNITSPGAFGSYLSDNPFGVQHYRVPNTKKKTELLVRGPQTCGYNEGIPHACTIGYANSGFLTLQKVFDEFILNQTGALDVTNLGVESNSAPFSVDGMVINLALFPIAGYRFNLFFYIVKLVLAIFYMLSFIFPVSRLIRAIVLEKETRIKEGMKCMGLEDSVFFAGWYFTCAVQFCVTSLLITLVAWTSVFGYSDKSLIFIWFFSFGMSVTALCFFIGVFFSKAKTASVLGTLLFFASFFPYYAVNAPDMDATTKTLASLLAPCAFALGSSVVADFEGGGQGVKWSNMHMSTDNYSFQTSILMMVFDFFLFTFLAWYLDKVIPTEFGTREPFLFFLTPKYWGFASAGTGLKDEKNPLLTSSLAGNASATYNAVNNPNIEGVSDDLLSQEGSGLGVFTKGLRKVYETTAEPKVAVHGLDLSMFENQITVLLGHNGAGKSTTISMLTGMVEPSSGDAIIRGLSVNNDMAAIRNSLGVCPQHDILFDELTVEEHLQLYATFKGVSAGELNSQVSSIIASVGLQDKTKVLSSSLSGGMKRKLSVGIALIGDSKIVILDEPTSGMDPYSRRATWELLRNSKAGRAIMLTTHFMDEADILGDRIAIMSQGKLECAGSSLFLKNRYGVGYTMTLVTDENKCDSTNVMKTIQSHVKDAELLSDAGSELAYRLPLTDAHKFSALFSKFEDEGPELGITTFGISVTTLEEVFLRVAHGDMSTAEAARLSESTANARSNSFDSLQPIERDTSCLFCTHFNALIRKRFIYARRDFRGFIFQVFIPVIFVLFGLSLLTIVPSRVKPSLDLNVEAMGINSDVDSAEKNIVPVNASGSAFAKLVQEQLQNMHGDLSVDTSPSTYTCTANDGDACGAQHWNKTSGDLPEMTAFNDFLLHTRNTHRGSRYGALLFSGDDSKSDNETHTRQTMDDFNFTVFVNASLIHASPIYINLVHQAILKTKVKHARINVRNFPLPLTKRQVELSKGLNSFFAALMIMVSFSFLPASYAIFVVKEREVKAKHQQNVSGVSMTAYWLSTFVWDSVSSLIPSGLTLLLFRCFGIDAFVEGEAGVACALLFFLFGPAVAAFTYCISFVFASHSTAQNIVLFLNFVTGLILMIVNFVLNQVESTRDVNQHLKNLYRLFPGFCLADGMAQLSFCVHDKCLNNGDIFHLLSPMDWNVCGGHIVFLTCEAVLYFMLCMLIEYLHLYPAFAAFCAGRGCANEASLITDEMVAPEAPEDEDVINERTRVSSGGANSDIIRLHNFRKVYPGGCTGRPDKMAVKSLDFGIKGGECFGFLGTNGAGKTTTLSILSGEYPPSVGTAFIDNHDIRTEQGEIRRHVGYCPQFDALLELLTVREHLELYARIKCIKEGPDMTRCVEDKLEQMDLRSFANKAAGSLSGGNKRKLSVAIAMIGDPRIVFLDEPSTGMDPVARRFMWEVIANISTRSANGQCSVILTTHSMEEAEALCSRIGIMVLGRLRCLGTPQHLKNKFGNGYEVDMKLNLPSPAALSALQSEIARASSTNESSSGARAQIVPFSYVPSGDDLEDVRSEAPVANANISMQQLSDCCNALGGGKVSFAEVSEHGTGFLLHKTLEETGSVSVDDVCSWWIMEMIAFDLASFMAKRFPGAELLERASPQSFRYKVPQTDMKISVMFAVIEENKKGLTISEYSVGSTTLEQVFNGLAGTHGN